MVVNLHHIEHLANMTSIGTLEAPNEEAAMQFRLKVGSLGNIRTTTLRAFTEEEIASVIDKLD